SRGSARSALSASRRQLRTRFTTRLESACATYRLRSISYDCSRQLDGSRSSVRRSRPVSVMTTADLARDGMLTTNHRFGSARLKRPFWKLLARADEVIE